LIMSTAAVCLVIGLSIFTTQKTIEAEGRRTRGSMPGVLNNPLRDGESLITKIGKLNATLTAINKRLTRLEEISNLKNKGDNSEIKAISSKISKDVNRITARLNTLTEEQATLKYIPSQLRIIDQNMRIILLAKEEAKAAESPTPEEIVKTLDWMVQKIDNIDSYFPPLYNFLGAIYIGNGKAASDSYPSVDKRLNEVMLQLDDLQQDMTTTLKYISPYIREPTKRPRPFEK
nr:hypothetical protein [Kiritimatiellia bacterium]